MAIGQLRTIQAPDFESSQKRVRQEHAEEVESARETALIPSDHAKALSAGLHQASPQGGDSNARIALVPRISAFFGIVIEMYSKITRRRISTPSTATKKPSRKVAEVFYVRFGDYCRIAAEVLGTTPEQVARLPRIALADSALASPRAGFGDPLRRASASETWLRQSAL